MGIVKTVLIDIVFGGFMGTKWALGKICGGAFIRVSGKRIEHVTRRFICSMATER